MISIAELQGLPYVRSANEWRDRVYINVKGNGGDYRGERNTKVWLDRDGQLHIERGRGTTSRDFDANLQTLDEYLQGGK